MIIHLIRHGQTNWNKNALYQGTKDIPMNHKGIEESRILADRLKHFRIDTLYSSPLKRAVDTAQSINAHHKLDIVVRDNLREIELGEWEGLNREQVKAAYPKALGTFTKDTVDTRPPGGESFKDLSLRVQETLRDIVLSHGEDDEIVIVTHGGVIKNIIADILRMSLPDRRLLMIDNASLSTLIYNHEADAYFLRRYNDTAHLE